MGDYHQGATFGNSLALVTVPLQAPGKVFLWQQGPGNPNQAAERGQISPGIHHCSSGSSAELHHHQGPGAQPNAAGAAGKLRRGICSFPAPEIQSSAVPVVPGAKGRL